MIQSDVFTATDVRAPISASRDVTILEGGTCSVTALV